MLLLFYAKDHSHFHNNKEKMHRSTPQCHVGVITSLLEHYGNFLSLWPIHHSIWVKMLVVSEQVCNFQRARNWIFVANKSCLCSLGARRVSTHLWALGGTPWPLDTKTSLTFLWLEWGKAIFPWMLQIRDEIATNEGMSYYEIQSKLRSPWDWKELSKELEV